MAGEQHNINWIAQVAQGGPYNASIKIKANPAFASTVTNRMEPYKNLPNKFRPALIAVADYMTQKAIPRTFAHEGPGWRPLSLRTQRERKAAGFDPQHPILIRTGDLFRELTDRSHPKHVEIIKVGAQARIIIGGRSEKFVRNQLGNSMLRLPARSMIPGTGGIPLGNEDQSAMKAIMAQKIQEAMSRNA